MLLKLASGILLDNLSFQWQFDIGLGRAQGPNCGLRLLLNTNLSPTFSFI
jgi:hypothetical protein